MLILSPVFFSPLKSGLQTVDEFYANIISADLASDFDFDLTRSPAGYIFGKSSSLSYFIFAAYSIIYTFSYEFHRIRWQLKFCEHRAGCLRSS